jgi:hypothetical protein
MSTLQPLFFELASSSPSSLARPLPFCACAWVSPGPVFCFARYSTISIPNTDCNCALAEAMKLFSARG